MKATKARPRTAVLAAMVTVVGSAATTALAVVAKAVVAKAVVAKGSVATATLTVVATGMAARAMEVSATETTEAARVMVRGAGPRPGRRRLTARRAPPRW